MQDPEIKYKVQGQIDNKAAEETLSWLDKLKKAAGEIKDAYTEAGGAIKGMFAGIGAGSAFVVQEVSKLLTQIKQQAEAIKTTYKETGDASKGLEARIDAQAQKLKQQQAVESALAKERAVRAAAEKKDAAEAKVKTEESLSGMAKLREQAGLLSEAYRRGGGGISGLFDVLTSGAGKAVLAMAAVGAAIAAATKSLLNYAGAEQRLTALDVALAKRGQLTDDYRERLHNLANEMQRLTTIDNDDWIEALTKLTQYGSTADTIDRDAEAVKNLAGLYGGDLVSAAQEWGKALQGNFQGLTRHGLVLDENASKAEKLNQALQFLAKAGGGQLEAQTETLVGVWNTFKNGMGDMMEVTGAMVSSLGVVQAVLYGLGTSMTWVSDKLYALFGVATEKTRIYNDAVISLTVSEQDATAAKARYVAALQDVEARVTSTTAALDAQNEAVRQQASIEDDLTNRRATRDKARIDLQLKLGTITKEQADLQKALVDAKASEEKYGRAQETAKAEEANIQRRIELLQEETAEVVRLAEARREEAARYKEFVDRVNPQLGQASRDVSFWETQRDAFAKEPDFFSNAELGVEKSPGNSRLNRHAEISGMIGGKLTEAQERLKSLTREARQGRTQFDPTALADAPAATAAANDFANRSYAITNQLEAQRDSLRRATGGRATARALEVETQRLTTPNATASALTAPSDGGATDRALNDMTAGANKRVQLLTEMTAINQAETDRMKRLAEAMRQRASAQEGAINAARNP